MLIRIAAALIILLGVGVPSGLLTAQQLIDKNPVGVEVPASAQEMREMLVKQAITIADLRRRELFLTVALCSAILASTIAFLTLLFSFNRARSKNGQQGNSTDPSSDADS